MNVMQTMLTRSTFQRLQKETFIDPTLKALHAMVTTGWSRNQSAVPVDLLSYWSFRDDISTYEGVLVKARQGPVVRKVDSAIQRIVIF